MISDILKRSPMIPVLTINRLEDAEPLCRTLLEGGLPVLEITLRTEAALAAIETVARMLPQAIVGVGTVLDPADMGRVRDAGAAFAVSPGLNMDLVEAAGRADLPYLPGIQTASEAMSAWRAGLRALKFFPAKAAGGPYGVQQLRPLFPGLIFCPTGGITFADAPDWLAEPNVACVGGGFVTPADRIAAQDWAAIGTLARRAAALRPPPLPDPT